MRFHILHTNDLHGHLEHWPVISAFLKDRQQTYRHQGEAVLTLDIGDAMDAVHPMVEASQGRIIVDLFNQVGYDIVTLGNNEGLNYSKDDLRALFAEADYQVVIGNLLDQETGDYPSWAQPYIIKEIQGLKLAFIGLTAPYATYTLNNYDVLDPEAVLAELLQELKEDFQPDFIVLLSHLGIDVDRDFAQKFPEINLILGGHTHHVFVSGEEIGSTTLAAAGRYGDFVGEVTLDFDEALKEWEIKAQAHTIEQLASHYELPVEDDHYRTEGDRRLRSDRICRTDRTFLARDLKGPDSFIQMALDAIASELGLDIAVLNSGLFLSDLPMGWVTAKDLHEALPHPMHLAVVDLKGWQLEELLEEMAGQEEDLIHQNVFGLGFRGKLFGEIVWKGIQFHEMSQTWSVHSRPIVADQVYRFVTVDHLWFLPYFPTIGKYSKPKLIFPKFLRHVVSDYLQREYA